MKKTLSVLFILCILSISLSAQEDTLTGTPNTRGTTLAEALPGDSLLTSPLFRVFDGIGLNKSLAAYSRNTKIADSLLLLESDTVGLAGKTWNRARYLFMISKDDSRLAMSLVSPIFFFILIIIMIPLIIKAFILRPTLPEVVKPTHDKNAGMDATSGDDASDLQE